MFKSYDALETYEERKYGHSLKHIWRYESLRIQNSYERSFHLGDAQNRLRFLSVNYKYINPAPHEQKNLLTSIIQLEKLCHKSKNLISEDFLHQFPSEIAELKVDAHIN